MSQEPVLFYEREFYVFSNFSSFMVEWKGLLFPTSEHVYHFEKLVDEIPESERKFAVDVNRAFGIFSSNYEKKCVQEKILNARSAHDAQKIARQWKHIWRSDWNNIKIDVMEKIIRAKAEQHEYVMRKLLQTGDREIIEDSWRDDFWGWGENKDGQNHLGKLWMKLREELRQTPNSNK